MRTITPAEFKANKLKFLREFKKTIFIYPTDTIYGIGCDATNGVLVEEIRKLKGRADMPFSVIAPSKDWIHDICVVTKEAEKWLDKLPGPYTLILKLKKPEEICFSVNNGSDTLGVRIPDHWISDVVSELKIPIVTTSANRTGENHMKNIEGLSSVLKQNVEFVLYEGELTGTPSTLVHLESDEVEVKKR